MAGIPLTSALVAVALLGGGLAGYVAGAHVRGRLRAFWAHNASAVLGCAALDFAALATGRYALGYAAIGLMGGLLTGLKYGYTDSLRSWPEPEPADDPAEDPKDAGELRVEQPLDDGEGAVSAS